MALSGNFYGTTSNSRIKPTITWSAVQSVVGNYSEITAILTYKRNNDQITGGSWSGSLTIGDQSFEGSKRFNITNDADAEAIRATARVYHDEYGALTVTIAATGAIAGSTLTSTTISAEIQLDTIPRASDISAVDANIGSRSTIVVSRKNTNYTHSVAYSFGALSGYINASGSIVDSEVKLSATTINFLLPDSFYEQIPNDPTGVCRLTCTTYSGNTKIGNAQSAEFTVTASESLCAPELDYDIVATDSLTEKLTGSKYTFVSYISTVLCTLRAQAQHGAKIVETTIAGVVAQERTIEKIETDTITFQAKDSRGYVCSYTRQLSMIPYIPLTNNATLQRTDPTSGKAKLTMQGSCWKGNFGVQGNQLSYEYSVDGGGVRHGLITIGADGTYLETEILSGLDYLTAHTVELTVSDSVMSVTKRLTVNKGLPVFDWGEEDFCFHVPVDLPALTVGGVSLETYIRNIINK